MEKCRYIAVTDVNPARFRWTEKDDIQSLVRLLLYSNEIDIEGIVLCSSCFLKRGGGKKAATTVNRLLDAYAAVKPNLDRHAEGYPEAETLRQRVFLGIPAYGAAPGTGFAEKRYLHNPGVQCIIHAVDQAQEDPVWIGLWGGANTLAQAVWQVSRSRSEGELNDFLGKLRIHSISDQDNSAHWLRQQFGDRLFYIVTPSAGSMAGAKEYFRAVWPGISADRHSHGSEDGIHGGGFFGAETELVSDRWIEAHIREKGPLGRQYPKTVYIMEGDTPAYLGLIPNGLNVPERPDYGGWGGRYQQARSPENAPIWTGAADCVLGDDGAEHCSPQASLWRWREAFQYDFAARMEWSADGMFDHCSHPPIVRLNVPDVLRVAPGQTVILDAGASVSPDGVPLSFRWFWYPEAGDAPVQTNLSGADTPRVAVQIPPLPENADGAQFHLILEVTGARKFSLVRYRRIIFSVRNGSDGAG